MAASTQDCPEPPYSSGSARPVKPSSAICFHSFSGYPIGSSSVSRTTLTGEHSAHIRCTVSRSICCSSLKSRSIFGSFHGFARGGLLYLAPARGFKFDPLGTQKLGGKP